MRTAITLVCAGVLAAPSFAQQPTAPPPAVTVKPIPPADAALEKDKAKENAAAPLALGMRLDKATLLTDIDGKEHKAGDYKNKIVVVNFWSTTCPIMAGYEQTLEEIEKTYEAKGIVFLTVNANEANGEFADAKPASAEAKPYQKIRDHLKAKKLDRTVLIDNGSVLATKLGAKKTPDTFVFAADGKLSYHGAIDDNPNGKNEKPTPYLKNALDELLAGKPVTKPETTPVGCEIKFARKAPMNEKPAEKPAAPEKDAKK